jgi:hypothetical protein
MASLNDNDEKVSLRHPMKLFFGEMKWKEWKLIPWTIPFLPIGGLVAKLEAEAEAVAKLEVAEVVAVAVTEHPEMYWLVTFPGNPFYLSRDTWPELNQPHCVESRRGSRASYPMEIIACSNGKNARHFSRNAGFSSFMTRA